VKGFVDSDLLIWHLRGDPRALDLLRGLRDAEGNELWTGAMQRAEVLFADEPVASLDPVSARKVMAGLPVLFSRNTSNA